MNYIYHPCPRCQHTMESRLALAGFKVDCPDCGFNGILVPEQSTTAPKSEDRNEIRAVAADSEHATGLCFLCQQEREGKRRCLAVSTVHFSGAWQVRTWINVRCFCCDACTAAWRWHYAKRFLILFAVAGCVAASVGILCFFLPDLPRESALRNWWVWAPLAVCLFVGFCVGLTWLSVRFRKMIHPDAREKLETLLGAQFIHLRVRDRAPIGERVINCY